MRLLAFVVFAFAALSLLVCVSVIGWHILTSRQRVGRRADGSTLYDLPFLQPERWQIVQAFLTRLHYFSKAHRRVIITFLAIIAVLGVSLIGVTVIAGGDAPRTTPPVGFLATSPGRLTFMDWQPTGKTTQRAVWDDYRQIPGSQSHQHGGVVIVLKSNLTLTVTLTLGKVSEVIPASLSYGGDKLSLQLPRDARGIYPTVLIMHQVSAATYNAALVIFGNDTPLPSDT